MDTPTRRRVVTGLLAAGGGVALVYTASRIVPKLMRKLMRGMMRSMMQEMMRGEGGFARRASSDNPPEA
jgi:hypothetical protein